MTTDDREKTRRYVERLDARFRTLRDEVEEDVARIRGLSADEVDRRLAALVQSAWRVLEELPDEERRRLLARDPPAPDFATTWQRLVERKRAAG